MLFEELADFQVSFAETGHARFNAREGARMMSLLSSSPARSDGLASKDEAQVDAGHNPRPSVRLGIASPPADV
jgi:hypothetical protein